MKVIGCLAAAVLAAVAGIAFIRLMSGEFDEEDEFLDTELVLWR